MTPAQFIGSWELESWRMSGADGIWVYPLGADAEGMLIYAPDGYMFAALTAAGRAAFQGDDPLNGSAYECLMAARSYHSYGGRYRLEEDRIIHAVETALYPNLVGTEQVRYWRFDGDDHLVLTTPPVARAGICGVAELVWRRAPPVAD
jgi:hypothetical protein